MKLAETPKNLRGGNTRWKFRREWIAPPKWYWGIIGWYNEVSDVERAGASWLKVVTDFEIATRVTMGGSKRSRSSTQEKNDEGNGASSVKQKAHNVGIS